jgi:hypothetical protein
MKHNLLQPIATALILGYTSLSFASSNSVTVFPAEGNKQCSDYSSNSLVKQMGTGSPLASGVVSGAENPNDADSTGESASYTVAGGTVASFSAATTPIDYAILKSGRSVTVLIYPSGGVTSDANMSLIVNALPLKIDAISLCYGLGNTTPPPPPPPPLTTVPRCEVLLQGGGLDDVGITCPSNGERSIVFNLEVDKSFYNTDGTPTACVCNSPTPLTECDPSVAAGSPNACPDPVSTSKRPTEVTTHIELNNDPYYCTTVAGIRKCYSY